MNVRSRRSRVFGCVLLAVAITMACVAPDALADDSGVVRSIRIDGPVTAVTADYVERALEEAVRGEAAGFLIELDTPGGDLTSTQRIIQLLLNSEVPTVVWVGPSGAQAASAGTFIVLAAHAAGMAPRTTIGAASPVASGGEDLPETMGRKATEDMSATARSLADRRGASAAEWAERAVRDAESIYADEARDLGVVDALADEPAALLVALEGLEVEVAGEAEELHLVDAELDPVPLNTGERLLMLLVHPAVALLLLTVGVNAILIELSSPGGFVPGTIGVVALALGFYSLGVLEANLTGLVFLAAAFALFFLDLKSPTHGLLSAGGILLFVVGAAIMFSGGYYAVPWPTIIALALGSAMFFAFAISAVIRAMRRQPATGAEGMIGQRAVVRTPLDPAGTVLVKGELWKAIVAAGGDAGPIGVGRQVRILGIEGHTLIVRPDEPGA